MAIEIITEDEAISGEIVAVTEYLITLVCQGQLRTITNPEAVVYLP